MIVNTCCVTHTASAKSRQYIRKAKKLNPNAVIAVCGCLTTVQNGELNDLGENTCLINRREDLAGILKRIAVGEIFFSDVKELSPCPPCLRLVATGQNTIIKTNNDDNIKCKNNLTPLIELPSLTSFKGHTRAFLKVQDGCDGYCTYCIVPKTRPFVHNKPDDLVLQEARALVAAGHKEIVITGVFLGAYGQQTVRRKNWPDQQNDNLAKLLDKIAQIPGLARIRLSSLEPGDVTPQLLDIFCKHRNIMPHLHLSLQSGSNEILKKMCRQYDADNFREKVEMIKSRLDKPAITTDIIVGFPAENDADFEQTVTLAKEVGFAKMHVFAFSLRKGTAAAMIQNPVDKKIIKERSKILRELDKKMQSDFRKQFIGETTEVLLENSTSQPHGRAERYFYVYLNNSTSSLKANELIKVKLIKNEQNGVLGELFY
ncbi:MAG: tRNA (N(6)-L-threonylcarbamoyladenosine(37)-C(2))-methylthiotransferase MtaB [Planctomycetes bacterium RBG_13_46_10]|nr:MAG: tRNA (N(6)-L-threonylcarbamoyladenosine(37)-C(2))-methylthiotransferase MtaB [Planctomycetes bacterium RBG_13_46_10]